MKRCAVMLGALAFGAGVVPGVVPELAWGQTSPTVAPAAAVGLEDSARLVWLDKTTNRRRELLVTTAAPVQVAPLQIELTRCVPDLQGVFGTDAAWLTVRETTRSGDWFAGWMINTRPEMATLEHPRFDLMVVGCGAKPRRKPGATASARVVEEVIRAAPEGDPEGDPEAAVPVDPNDPFFVPGVGPSAPQAEGAFEMRPADAAAAEDAPPPIELELESRGEAVPVVPEPAPPAAPPAAQDQLHRMMDGIF